MKATPLTNPAVIAVFEQYPDSTRNRLLQLRQMIFDVASQTDGVGELEETLKWGQISYLNPSGTTIRIDAVADHPEQIAMYVHCQTTLMETYRALFGDLFQFEGHRCIKFDTDFPVEAVQHCIALALTYRLKKKQPTQ